MALGVHLNLLIGPTVPLPAPPPLIEALTGVEVTHRNEQRSGFQLTFQLGKGPKMALDFALMQLPQLKPGSRVILSVVMGAMPKGAFEQFIGRHV